MKRFERLIKKTIAAGSVFAMLFSFTACGNANAGKGDLKEITLTSTKIINRIEENSLKNKTAKKFMDYYLPVCVKIIGRYDEIENQSLTSKDSKEFMQNTSKILKATNKAFRKILNSLYQSDIIDADAEMKVFNTMLTADGFDETILEDGEKDE